MPFSAPLLLALFWLPLAVAAGPAASPTPATAPDPLTPVQRAWLAAHQRIRFGVGEEWAPWVIRTADGGLTGYAVDHLHLLAAKLGSEFALTAGPWASMVAAAETRTLDGLTLTAALPERRKHFLFTADFHTVQLFMYLRDGDPLPAPGLAGLAGRRVGYLAEVLRERVLLATQPGIKAVPLTTQAALGEALLTGTVDAVIGSWGLEYWRASNGVLGFAPRRVLPEGPTRLGLSVRNDWPELVDILNRGLAAISTEESATLHRRWFGRDDLFALDPPRTDLTAAERAWLADHPVLRVGLDPAWAPVEFFDEARRPQGISVTLLRRIAERLGLRLQFVETPSWAATVARFDAGQLDLLPAVAVTPSRRLRLRLTEPYVRFPAAIYAAADVAWLGGIEALHGRTVAVVGNDAVHEWLATEQPGLRLLPLPDTAKALRAVARGEAFAFIGNLATTSYYLGAAGLDQIKVLGETPFVYRLGMAVRPEDALLGSILQKGLDAVPREARDAIYHDWVSIRYRVEPDRAMLWRVVAAAALLLGLIGWWALRLAREVQRRRTAEGALAALSQGLDQALAARTEELAGANARLRALALDLSLADANARARLAAELHDSPMQKLALAQMQVEAARRGPADAETATLLDAGRALLREVIAELRTLQFDLSPPALDREGLSAALARLAAQGRARAGLPLDYQAAPDLPAIGPAAAVILFQCARELVYNLIRHARASRASIRLAADAGTLTLTVTDDGIGPAPAAAPTGGFGLRNVRERLALLDGTLDLTPAIPGTRACIRVPVARLTSEPAPWP